MAQKKKNQQRLKTLKVLGFFLFEVALFGEGGFVSVWFFACFIMSKCSRTS